MAPVPYGIGSAIDDALTSAIENMREKRLRTFFDELASGAHELTEDLIQQENFLHAYFSTLKAAINTRRAEKINLFARLLSNAARTQLLDSDVFEEFLNILDELSLRELLILLILKRFEDSHLPKTTQSDDGKEVVENDLQRANRFWGEFEKAVKENTGIEPDELRAVLSRLNRSGLYETIVGTYLGYSGGRGKLTPLFAEFVDWLQAREEEILKE